jgi:hypothetical protein
MSTILIIEPTINNHSTLPSGPNGTENQSIPLVSKSDSSLSSDTPSSNNLVVTAVVTTAVVATVGTLAMWLSRNRS